MELTAVLGLLTLLVGVPLNAFVTYLLWQKSRQAPNLRVLKERFVVSLLLTIVLVVFALIFVNNDQEVPPISDVATKYITRIAMLAIAIIPALFWLRIYRRRRTERKGPGRREGDRRES